MTTTTTATATRSNKKIPIYSSLCHAFLSFFFFFSFLWQTNAWQKKNWKLKCFNLVFKVQKKSNLTIRITFFVCCLCRWIIQNGKKPSNNIILSISFSFFVHCQIFTFLYCTTKNSMKNKNLRKNVMLNELNSQCLSQKFNQHTHERSSTTCAKENTIPIFAHLPIY